MIKTDFMNLYEELSFLNEAEDPYLRAAMQMFQTDEDAKGVVVSCKQGRQAPIKVCKLYHSEEELKSITKNLYSKYGNNLYILAFHDRRAIEFYNNKWQKADIEEQKEAQKVIDDLFNKKLQTAIKNAGVADRISRSDFSALYAEYLPKNAPADGDEQDRLIKLFIKALKQKTEQEDTQETTGTGPKNARLNKARQNNIKIVKAFQDFGLPADDLTVTAKNKNGQDYRKASTKLNSLRKTLFDEALGGDGNPFNQEF